MKASTYGERHETREPVLGREQGDTTVFTKRERKEAKAGTSSSTSIRPSEREDRAGRGSFAGHMKAIVRDTYGSPDVLELGDIDEPKIEDAGVLVRVHAASVNPADWHLLRGMPHIARLQLGLRKPRTGCWVVTWRGGSKRSART